MNRAERHNAIVDRLIELGPDLLRDEVRLKAEMAAIAPDITMGEFNRALQEVADLLEERASLHECEREALLAYLPLFDGEPEGSTLEEVARRKAATGDPLAIRCLVELERMK